MLEIKSLTKIYTSKTGESVKALDDVSISFPESGMVFILGKSGSGKSTLLNVMGGLDSYDSGEFIIKGKSSKDFAGSDFDAYRNTFIGFIFQEYNVLDDFTVGANIGLALELQGKKATDETINAILAKVDLLNYARRKPNELSGGQKQRVAIARALVKEPEIIMADEPTGALDSNTGKQIFDTLKELSKEKLVLIVSHDRDFAEKYADRIIELSDGKIISDVTKHEKESVALSEGINQVTGNILRIKGGYRLTARDLEMINEYLAQAEGDILLSSDARVNGEMRSAAGIGENGNTSVFEGTDREKDIKVKEYDGKKTRFIRSKLPMKNAVRIGSSSLKHKKFRLVMTILLSMIAFFMFGFADTLASYNKVKAASESLLDSDIKNATFELNLRTVMTYSDGDTYTSYRTALMNDEDIALLREQTGLDFVPVYTGGNTYRGGFSMANLMQKYEKNTLYTATLTGLVDMSEASVSSAGMAVTGRLPEKAGEIAITEFMYRQFNEYGFKNSAFNEAIPANQVAMTEGEENSIIGKHITFNEGNYNFDDPNGYSLVIVGVVDTQFDYDRYSAFSPENSERTDANALANMVLTNELDQEINYGFHALGFAHKDSITELSSMSYAISEDMFTYMHGFSSAMYIGVTSRTSGEKLAQIDYVAGSSALSTLKVEWIDGMERTQLAENEIIINKNLLSHAMQNDDLVLPVTQAEVDAKMSEIYGADAWEATGTYYNDYYRRAEYAGLINYINEQVHKPDVLEAVKEHAQNNGMTVSNTEEAKSYWASCWLDNGQEYAPVINEGSLDTRSYVMSQSIQKLIPYAAELYEIQLPDNYMNLSFDFLAELFSEYRTDDFALRLTHGNINTLLCKLEAVKVVYEKELWNDDSFISAMMSNGYVTADIWNSTDAQSKKDLTVNFYAEQYLQMSDLGWEKNKYGASGTEISELAYEKLAELGGASINDMLSDVIFSRFESDHELQTEFLLDEYDFNVVGFLDDHFPDNVIVSDKVVSDYNAWYSQTAKKSDYHVYTEETTPHASGIWSFAVAPLQKDADLIYKLVNMSYDPDAPLRFELRNSIMTTLESFNDFIEVGAKVFLYVGIGFAVFAALLLMNFISTSISYKKREIGILRAVGARSSDVFKIFFSEAFIIAMINFVLSLITLIGVTIFVNELMHNEGINITLLTFGPRQFILMLGVSVAVAALSSFLPVYRIAKRKPIDAIRDK